MRTWIVAGLMAGALGTAWALDTDDLVLYAPMDEGAGNTVADFSPTGAVGDILGDAVWTAGGYVGGALEFGASGAVEFVEDAALNLTEELTMVAWILPSSAPGDSNLFGRRNSANAGGYTMQWTANMVEVWVHFGGWTGTRGSQAIVPEVGEWHFVASVYDGSDIFQYVDGELDAEVAAGGDVDEMPEVFRIGEAQTGLIAMPGIIDEVAVYGRALALDELEDIRANGVLPLAVKAQGNAATQWADMQAR
ncbi:MAG: LamG domain-containing protein [Candidatus Poribacteria bacterium]